MIDETFTPRITQADVLRQRRADVVAKMQSCQARLLPQLENELLRIDQLLEDTDIAERSVRL